MHLDSGTLTPLLKKLEAAGYLKRYRKPEDERLLVVAITEEGRALREEAEKIPGELGCMLAKKGDFLTLEELENLKRQLYRIIEVLK
ncbi:MAG: MarR family transcriptional regulator [Selenomonas ruminantium]|nr:MarR family transcriptional regulator [Selenomonas ruminantium]